MQRSEVTLNYTIYSTSAELPIALQQLFLSAENAMHTAYAPYSKFSVGAALLLESGEVVTGSNQENIAYPSGLCAERVALFYAGAQFPEDKIQALVIVAQGDLLPMNAVLSPCGSCRQVMAESEMRQKHSFHVYLRNPDGSIFQFDSASDLLPFVFGK